MPRRDVGVDGRSAGSLAARVVFEACCYSDFSTGVYDFILDASASQISSPRHVAGHRRPGGRMPAQHCRTGERVCSLADCARLSRRSQRGAAAPTGTALRPLDLGALRMSRRSALGTARDRYHRAVDRTTSLERRCRAHRSDDGPCTRMLGPKAAALGRRFRARDVLRHDRAEAGTQCL